MYNCARKLILLLCLMVLSDAQLRWSCRRGMLELDVILARFVSEGLAQLSAADKLTLARLLDCPDPDLYVWLMGQVIPDDVEIAALVTTIRTHAHVG